MKMLNAVLLTVVISVAAITIAPKSVVAADCVRVVSLRIDADVYNEVPQFITGRGWQGTVIARLPASTRVYICSELSAQFGLSSKAWLQIAFEFPAGVTAYGWILKDVTTAALSRDKWYLTSLSPIGAANAEQATSASASVPWPSNGTAPPAPSATPTTSQSTPSTPPVGDLAKLYGPLFIAMVVGMVAKALFDAFDHQRLTRAIVVPHLRTGLLAVLVSPIVFLGILNAGQFSVQAQEYLVLLLLAFQNGFFWQTVLKRQDAVSSPVK